MKNIGIVLVLSIVASSAHAVTCGVYEAGKIPHTKLFKKAKAACQLGDAVLNQAKFGENNRTLLNIDNCEFNLSLDNRSESGFIKLKLAQDRGSIEVDAFGVKSEMQSDNGSFYFSNEISLGRDGFYVLKCADYLLVNPASNADAKLYPKGWHPGSKK